MNAAEKARLEYLQELPRMEIVAELGALLKTADYNAEFEARYERLEIRRASERAQWINLILPKIKSAGRNSAAVAEARSV